MVDGGVVVVPWLSNHNFLSYLQQDGESRYPPRQPHRSTRGEQEEMVGWWNRNWWCCISHDSSGGRKHDGIGRKMGGDLRRLLIDHCGVNLQPLGVDLNLAIPSKFEWILLLYWQWYKWARTIWKRSWKGKTGHSENSFRVLEYKLESICYINLFLFTNANHCTAVAWEFLWMKAKLQIYCKSSFRSPAPLFNPPQSH